MATNKPVFYISRPEVQERAVELGMEINQFVDGCNRGGTGCSIGINTGSYDPSESSYARIQTILENASYIGHLEESQSTLSNRMHAVIDTDDQLSSPAITVAYAQATADTASGDIYSDIDLTNLTGGVIPDNSWAWGPRVPDPAGNLFTDFTTTGGLWSWVDPDLHGEVNGTATATGTPTETNIYRVQFTYTSTTDEPIYLRFGSTNSVNQHVILGNTSGVFDQLFEAQGDECLVYIAGNGVFFDATDFIILPEFT